MDPVSTAVAQARSLDTHSHRPWPVPDRPWTMGQTWLDLLFAHWPVSPETLRPHLPAALELDSFGGDAWIGITAFRVVAEIDFADGTDVRVEARRVGVPAARLSARYHAAGPPTPAEPGSLGHFLAERYCLYARRGDHRLLRAEIHHRRSPPQAAEAEIAHEELVPAGVELLADEPLLHFSRRQDVVVWSTDPVAGGC